MKMNVLQPHTTSCVDLISRILTERSQEKKDAYDSIYIKNQDRYD